MFPHFVTSAPATLPVSCDAAVTLTTLVREVTALMVALAGVCTAIIRFGAWSDHQKVLRATTAVAAVARSKRKEGAGQSLPRPRKASRSVSTRPDRHNDGTSRRGRPDSM